MKSCHILVVLAATIWCATASVDISTHEGFVSMWNVSLPEAQAPNIIPAEGVLLVSDVAAGWATVSAFNEMNGHFMWRWNSTWWGGANCPGLVPFLTPQVPGTIFFVQPQGAWMVALDLITGSVRWNYSCIAACSYSPVVSTDGSTICTADQAVIHAIDVASGISLWNLPVQYDYGFTTAVCGSAASGCVVVLQSAFNASTTLLFVDARSGVLLNSTVVLEGTLGASSFPIAAGNVVTFQAGNFLLGYSCVDYTLLWNQTVNGFEYVATYPAGLAGWKTPSILVATATSLAMQEVTGRERWNLTSYRLCDDDHLPPHFTCISDPEAWGLLEPREHALGVVAECTCWNQLNSSDSFTVSRFVALNTSNGVQLWAHAAHAQETPIMLPSADRTVALVEEVAMDTVIRVYDSGSFRFLHEWVVRTTGAGPFASSRSVFFLLDLAADGSFTVTGYRRTR